MLDKGLESFRDALLSEVEIARRQLLGMAEAIPAEKYSWRPAAGARTVGEVLVHISVGCFYLLELTGNPLPSDIYGSITSEGEERLWQIVRHNDKLEQTISAKGEVLPLLVRSLNSVADAITKSDDARLLEPVPRRIYLRLLVHTHEHMGQLIGYTRAMGLAIPWPDWRPDRR